MAMNQETVDGITQQTGETATGPSGSIKEAYRWSEQCYLAHNLKSILDPALNTYSPQKYKRPWHYVTSVTSLNSDTSTANFMNRFHLAEGDADFVNISTFERANMLWNMKLYKVFYKNVSEDTTLKQWDYDCELPLIFEQMALGDMKDYKDNRPSSYHRSNGDISGEKYKSRPQTGYGIKSFSWDYIGGNPETVRNDIEAKLVIEFQNFNQLSKIRTMSVKIKQADGKPKDEFREYSLLDLLGYGPNSDRNTEGEEDTYDPAFFEIKAVVEWQANEDVKSYDTLDPTKKTGAKKKKLKDKVKGQKTTLFLTLTDHSFSISQLGTFTLTLDYRARLESVASQMKANVLYQVGGTGTSYQALLAKDLEIREATKGCTTGVLARLKTERAWLQRQAWLQGFSSLLKEDIKSAELIGQYPKIAGDQEMKIPSRKRHEDVVKDLTGDAWPIGASGAGEYWRMFTFTSNHENMRHFLDGAEGVSRAFSVQHATTDPAAHAAAKELLENAFKGDAPDSPKTIDTANKELSDFFNRKLNWSQVRADKVDESGTIIPEPEKIDVQIPFIYLGDLLEIMAHRAFSDQGFTTGDGKTQLTGGAFGSAAKMKIIAGPVRLKNLSNPDELIECSLSDLPIAVEAFADFWYRNVIQTERPVYSFMEFVRDLGEQIINRAFGAGCAIDTHFSLDGQTRLKTGFLSLPQHSNGEDPLLHLKMYKEDGSVDATSDPYDKTTGDLIAELIQNVYDPSELATTAPDDIYSYVVLWLENQESSLKGLNGIETEDAPKGIYHLKIHQGILQSVDFQKTDQPYLRETRFTMLNEDPLVHLSNVYNVRASMVGNTCFYPGDIVYIDPVGFGTSLGNPMDERSLSRVMGLGGYHTVVSVSNKVSRDFTTEIEALWTSNSGVKPSAKLPCEDLK